MGWGCCRWGDGLVVALIKSVDDDGEGSVAGDIAGSAEVVHGDVEGNHECLFRIPEAKHGMEDAQGGHDGTARYSRSRHHDDTEHEDEANHDGGDNRAALHKHDGDGAGHDFECAAGEVDGGAEGNDESCHILVNFVAECLLQGDGDGGGGRLRAQCGEVGRHHAPEQQQRILAGYQPGHNVLQQKHADVQQEDDTDDFDEYAQQICRLSAPGHVEDNAEDIERQQGNDGFADGAGNDFAEVIAHFSQGFTPAVGHAQTQHESEDESGHYPHERGNGEGEPCRCLCGFAEFLNGGGRNHAREDVNRGQVRGKAGYKGCAVGQHSRCQQHFARLAADIGNGRSHQPNDEQGNQEAKILTEHSVEGVECANQLYGGIWPGNCTHYQRNDDATNQPETNLLPLLLFHAISVF